MAVDGEFYVEGNVGRWYNGSIKIENLTFEEK